MSMTVGCELCFCVSWLQSPAGHGLLFKWLKIQTSKGRRLVQEFSKSKCFLHCSNSKHERQCHRIICSHRFVCHSRNPHRFDMELNPCHFIGESLFFLFPTSNIHIDILSIQYETAMVPAGRCCVVSRIRKKEIVGFCLDDNNGDVAVFHWFQSGRLDRNNGHSINDHLVLPIDISHSNTGHCH